MKEFSFELARLIGFENDLQIKKNIDHQDCIRTCSESAQCIAYTYDRWNHWCFLKANAGFLRFDPKNASGIRTSAQPLDYATTEYVMERYRGKLFPGGLGEMVKSPSLEACEASCKNHDACVAYSYFKKTKECQELTDANEYTTSGRDVDSGAKRQNPLVFGTE